MSFTLYKYNLLFKWLIHTQKSQILGASDTFTPKNIAEFAAQEKAQNNIILM